MVRKLILEYILLFYKWRNRSSERVSACPRGIQGLHGSFVMWRWWAATMILQRRGEKFTSGSPQPSQSWPLLHHLPATQCPHWTFDRNFPFTQVCPPQVSPPQTFQSLLPSQNLSAPSLIPLRPCSQLINCWWTDWQGDIFGCLYITQITFIVYFNKNLPNTLLKNGKRRFTLTTRRF